MKLLVSFLGLSEFLIISQDHDYHEQIQCSESTLVLSSGITGINKNDFKWSVNQTKMLLDLYTEMKGKVGTLEVKNQKQLWKLIAKKLRAEGLDVTEENCHNRWRVVERNYKKYIDNQNATGRGRRYFEYIEEMNKIFGTKRNIHPVLVLSNEVNTDNMETETSKNENPQLEQRSLEPKEERMIVKQNVPRKKKKSVMELMREDRKLYFEQRLQIEKEKLQEAKRRNDLIEQRNNILRERNCHCYAN